MTACEPPRQHVTKEKVIDFDIYITHTVVHSIFMNVSAPLEVM